MGAGYVRSWDIHFCTLISVSNAEDENGKAQYKEQLKAFLNYENRNGSKPFPSSKSQKYAC